jgi:hypothetical protein
MGRSLRRTVFLSLTPGPDAPFDAKRAATDALAGYDWQRWLTLEAWLGLSEDEALWIEWAEDFVISSVEETRMIQAKSTSAPISLGQRRILEIIERALLRPGNGQTVVWTTAQPSREHGSPFEQPAIEIWAKLTATNMPVAAFKHYLATHAKLASEVQRKFQQQTDQQFRSSLRRVQWVTGEASARGIRERVHVAVERRLEKLGVEGHSYLKESATALLFEQIAHVSTLQIPERRRVEAIDLEDALGVHSARMNARTASLVDAQGAGLLKPASGYRPIEETVPFSPAWFVYSTRSIAMHGRKDELAKLDAFTNANSVSMVGYRRSRWHWKKSISA